MVSKPYRKNELLKRIAELLKFIVLIGEQEL